MKPTHTNHCYDHKELSICINRPMETWGVFFADWDTKTLDSVIVNHPLSFEQVSQVAQKSDRILSLQIAGLQGFYWMIYCPIGSFASVYLLSRHFSNQQIGWVIAISNILAILLQPLTGMLLDRLPRLSLKLVMSLFSILSLLLLGGLFLLDAGLLVAAILYVGILALMYTLQPLVTSITFQFINAGHDVSFGITRAAGSILFAGLSTVLGFLVKSFSTGILPLISVGLYVGFLLLVLSFPPLVAQQPAPGAGITARERGTHPLAAGFLRKYSRFIPFLLGIACLYLFHTIINLYLPQIISPLGGRESDMGISLTIAALCELPAFFGFNYLAARINYRNLLKYSGLLYAIRSVIFLLAGSMLSINLGQVFQGITFAIMLPASVYYVNKLMSEEDRMKGQTFLTGTMTLGSLFGSVGGGWLLDHFNVQALLVFGVIGAVVGSLLLFYATGVIKKPAVAFQE